MDIHEGYALIQKLKTGISSVVIGKESAVELMLTGLVSGGHVMIEDTPGTGKTLMAKTLAALVSSSFSRIQFTPDLLPADITGLNVYDQKEGTFRFIKGPVFSNIILADEINRATPRTQSALLEAMEEGQVTVDNETYILDKPFIVVATENPVETVGTFPLPEASLDRFAMYLSMGTLSPEDEVRMLNVIGEGHHDEMVEPVCTGSDIEAVKDLSDKIYVHDDLKDYMVKITQKTRTVPSVQMGVSPRATLWLMKTSKAHAFISGRDHVIPDDIKEVAEYVLAHRMITYAGRDIAAKRRVIKEILAGIEVPAEEWSRR
ncbi:MAG TPA: magnesium chelatase [Lachnospiraceae bacterium]|nr:magnesium chelatase [Lachnospiraceae bacterium]